jgi:hypothetical protein
MANEARSLEKEMVVVNDDRQDYIDDTLFACSLLGLVIGAVWGVTKGTVLDTVDFTFTGFVFGIIIGLVLNIMQLAWFTIFPVPGD